MNLFVSAQQHQNKWFIDKAEKAAIQQLDSIFGKKFVQNFIRLNKTESQFFDEDRSRSSRLWKSEYDFKISNAWLTYDLVYDADTIMQLDIKIDKNLRIRPDQSYPLSEMPLMIGWKKVLQNEFKFNYNQVKKAIKNEPGFDTTTNHISLEYQLCPQYINRSGKCFIETRFTWLVSALTPVKNSEYPVYEVARQIRLNTETGARMPDKPITPLFDYK